MSRAWRRAVSLGASAAAAAAAAARCDGERAADLARPTFTPCPEVACSSREQHAAAFLSATDGSRHQRPGRRRAAAAATAAAAEVGPAAAPAPAACPPAREELGAATWTLLHALAAYYPDAPSPEQRAAALGLVDALRLLYPCVHCRAQLAVDVERLPPRVGSRAEFSVWVCQQHNLVNELLGKPAFECSLQALDERWRTGRLECWAGGGAPSGAAAGRGKGQSAEESLGQG